ncbi:immunoglobulin lambda-1 light chain-like isoform X2 [Heliangelus exortis]|uniref:immunoglobulin lambda-1 light chain-like isoform X2 n=1 Tax=Heliangelus exortis TaxID=472823 RepID=UPI003A93456F
MAWAPLLLVVLAHTSGSLVQAALTQTPSVLSVKPGDTVTITCSGTTNSYGWYQQKVPGSAPVTVIYWNNKRPSDIPSRFSGSKSGSTGTLTITGVQAEDEAVYFCGSYDSSINAASVFGDGTRLSVIDQPKVAPTVYLFPPPSEEISKFGKATLVCLVQGFYPGTATVSWQADGQSITSGVETSPPYRQSDRKYVSSSYLSLEAREWERRETYTCRVTHEAGNVVKTLKRSEL